MTRVEHVPEHRDTVLVAYNPQAGAHDRVAMVKRLHRRLLDLGLRCETETDRNGWQRRGEFLHAADRLRAVVAAGGDGTATEVWNRLPPGVPVLPMPLGNENLLAGYLGFDRSVEEVAQAIRARRLTYLDAGLANGRLFSLMVSCGFDADVVRQVDQQRHGHIGRWSYIKAILGSLRGYQYPKLRVSFPASDASDGSVGWFSAEARWLFAFNLPCYGVGLPLAPEASASDGRLDMCLFRKGSLWNGLGYLASVLLRQHHRLTSAGQWRVTRFRVESDFPVPYQLDGDYGGQLPLEVEIQEGRLCTMVPVGWTPAVAEPLAAHVA